MPQTQQPLPMMQPHETDAATQRRRRLRDGSVTRRTFAPFASAQFRRIVQGHYIAQEAKSIAAVGGLSLPRRVWKERDPRRLGVGSVIRRTFAPLAAASFRLVIPGHCIAHSVKCLPAFGGFWLPRRGGQLLSAASTAAQIRRRVVCLFRVLLFILSHACKGWFGCSHASSSAVEATKP